MSKKTILIICTACLFITSIATSSYSLFLIPLQEDLDLSRSAASLPFTVAMIFWGISQPIAGRMADKYGIRLLIISGIILMLTGYTVMGFAKNYFTVVLGYGILIGISVSACGTTMFSLLISKHFSRKNRTTAVSICQTAGPGNPIIFGPLLYWILTITDWRTSTFTISFLLLFVALPLAVLGVQDPQDNNEHEGHNQGTNNELQQLSLWEHLGLFRNNRLKKLAIAHFVCGLGFFLTSQMVAIAINNNFSDEQSAFTLTVYGASAIIWVILAGLTADRFGIFGRSGTLATTFFIRGLGAIGLALPLLVQVNHWTLYLLIAISAGPIFATITIINVMIFETVGAKFAGIIIGLSFAIHQTAAALSTYLGGLSFDLTGNYQLVLFILGVITILTGVLVLSIKPNYNE